MRPNDAPWACWERGKMTFSTFLVEKSLFFFSDPNSVENLLINSKPLIQNEAVHEKGKH